MNVDIDFCGVRHLLKALVQADVCTIPEAKQIARRIAVQMGASLIFSVNF